MHAQRRRERDVIAETISAREIAELFATKITEPSATGLTEQFATETQRLSHREGIAEVTDGGGASSSSLDRGRLQSGRLHAAG